MRSHPGTCKVYEVSVFFMYVWRKNVNISWSLPSIISTETERSRAVGSEDGDAYVGALRLGCGQILMRGEATQKFGDMSLVRGCS